MKIGIIALSLLPDQMGGIETYLRDLLAGIDESDSNDQYYLFVPGLYKPTFPNYTKIKVVGINLHGVKPRLIQKLSNRTVFNQAAKKINKYDLDIAHYPLQIVLPPVNSKKTIISIMDIQQEYFPENFSKRDLAIRRKEYRLSCDLADYIIAISDFTKQSLIDKFGIKEEKISTIYLAVNRLENKNLKKPNKDFPEKFFFYPAASWPHKNHLKLLQAFKEFSQEYSKIHLVLTGIKKQQNNEIDKFIQNNNLGTWVQKLGYVSREKLNYLFANALALIFPSKFEGFGIPIIEAMNVGTPVIAADSTSIPEITEGAALLFNPDSKGDIISAMKKITMDSDLRSKLIKKGHLQAKKFTISAMTKKTLKLYKEAVSGK